MGVTARLLHPLPRGVEPNEQEAVGVTSSSSLGDSLMVRSSHDA